jgi:hypothetical protein
MNPILCLLATSVLINALLFIRWKLSEADLRQYKKMLCGTLMEKDRLRGIIKSFRNN